MTLAVPFHLKRRSAPDTVIGYWLLLTDRAKLASLCARFPGPWPTIHALDGGFLVLFERPPAQRIPGAIAVRRLAGHIYLPADADLIPALHEVEAEELTVRRGLFFPPHGLPIGFDLSAALRPADILDIPAAARNAWQPLPEAPVNAEELTKITDEGFQLPAAILEMGRPEPPDDSDGEELEDVRPPDASPITRFKEGLRYRAGKMLAGLGQALNLPGMARRGAAMIAKAVDQVPRLTEDILGKQEAALRELLRRFRAGDKDAALRQAPVAVGDPNSPPAPVDRGARLNVHSTAFSLKDLLAGSSRGSTWLGGGDIWNDLAEEYRKMAREAVSRGDHRRAAYIFGHLLRDLRSAADTLAAGGLYREAAILFRDKVKDEAAAARAFEMAGDFDDALEIYERLENHIAAAEIYRKLRDEERAIACFVRAAGELGQKYAYRAAGDLLRERLGRDDLAENYYRLGWHYRNAESIVCAERLFDGYLVAERWPELREFIVQAEVRFAPPHPAAEAGRFFNRVVGFAGPALPQDLAAEFRDRSKLALAKHLPTAGVKPPELFPKIWSPAFFRDAAYAQNRLKETAPKPPLDIAFQQLVTGKITACVMSRGSFDDVVGTEGGDVVCLRTQTGQVDTVIKLFAPVNGLAVDGDAKFVVTLHIREGKGVVRSYGWNGGPRFRFLAEKEFDDPVLLPAIQSLRGDSFRTYVDSPKDARSLLGIHLLDAEPDPMLEKFIRESEALRLVWESPHVGVWCWAENSVHFCSRIGSLRYELRIPWIARIPRKSNLHHPPIAWTMCGSSRLEIAGLTLEGELYWSEVDEPKKLDSNPHTFSFGDDFQAVDFLASRKLAAVTSKNRVHWLRVESKGMVPFAPAATLAHPVPAVGLFHQPVRGEVIVLFQDGVMGRLPIPR